MILKIGYVPSSTDAIKVMKALEMSKLECIKTMMEYGILSLSPMEEYLIADLCRGESDEEKVKSFFLLTPFFFSLNQI